MLQPTYSVKMAETYTHAQLDSDQPFFLKASRSLRGMGIFLVSLLIVIFFTIPALSAETSTGIIHYYFDLKNLISSSGGSGSLETTPVTPEDSSCPPCTLATMTQNPDTCECYCGKSLSDCLEDEVFNASQCRCEQCPENQVVIDGVCGCAPCSQENYILDEADCSCNCGLTASDCVSGEYFNASSCSCASCSTPTQTVCNASVVGVDSNGCPNATYSACTNGQVCQSDHVTCACPSGYTLENGVCVEQTASNSCPNSNYSVVNGNCVCGLVCDSGKQANSSCSDCVCSTRENCAGNLTWDSETCSCVCEKAGEVYGVGMHYDATTCEPVCDSGLVRVQESTCQKCNHAGGWYSAQNAGCGGSTPYCNIYNTCVGCYSHSHCASGLCVGLTSTDGGGNGTCCPSAQVCGKTCCSSDQVCQNGKCVDPCSSPGQSEACCNEAGRYWCGGTCYSSALSEGYCACSGGTWQGQSCCWDEHCVDRCLSDDLSAQQQCECQGGTWY